MTSLHLTQRRIDAFIPGKSVREFGDTELPGFGVRCLPTGRKRYFIHIQQGGQRIWKANGDAGTMSLTEARALTRSQLADIRNGEPCCEAGGKAETPFEEVAEAAFRRHARLWKPRTLAVNRLYLKNYILPQFRGQPISGISSRDVQQ